MSTGDPEPKRIYIRPPDDWEELTQGEKLAWAKEVVELITAQTVLEPLEPRVRQHPRPAGIDPV